MKKKTDRPGRDRDGNIIRQQWPKMSLAEKVKYIASYYGIAIAIVVLAAAAAVFLVRDIREKKTEDAFYVMAAGLSLTEETGEAVEQELSGALGLDPAAQRCRIEAAYSSGANMQSEATISAYMRSGRVDLVIAPEEVFNRYAATGYLAVLGDCGLQDLMEQYGTEDLFYASMVDYSRDGAVSEIPFHPHEVTEDSECYGIYLRDEVFSGNVLGVMVNCPNRERVRAGVQYFVELTDRDDYR